LAEIKVSQETLESELTYQLRGRFGTNKDLNQEIYKIIGSLSDVIYAADHLSVHDKRTPEVRQWIAELEAAKQALRRMVARIEI
jgi:hypothetical protein